MSDRCFTEHHEAAVFSQVGRLVLVPAAPLDLAHLPLLPRRCCRRPGSSSAAWTPSQGASTTSSMSSVTIQRVRSATARNSGKWAFTQMFDSGERAWLHSADFELLLSTPFPAVVLPGITWNMWQTPFLTGRGRKRRKERLRGSNASVLLSVLKVPEGFQMQIIREQHQISERLTSRSHLLFSDLQTQEKEEPIIREGSLKVS